MIRRVCHVTSNHNPKDGRVFERECRSLSSKYEVYLIASNTKDEFVDNVHIVGVDLPKSRYKRPFKLGRVYEKMIDIDADVYHFHDPELMSLGVKIKRERNKIIIFDSHEDFPAHFKSKYYIPKILRTPISYIYSKYEKHYFKSYDALVSVTPKIVERLQKICRKTYQITNYPIYKEENDSRTWERKIAFTGMIDPNWKLENVLKAIQDEDVCFEMAGRVTGTYLSELQKLSAWKKVNYRGIVPHAEVFEILNTCTIGMAIASNNNPNGSYNKGSIGVTKMFEYMSAGIPVIATDHELWIPIIEGNKCGFCVQCDDIDSIKEKISYLLNNPKAAMEMGDNGRRAIKEKYCWQTQEVILFSMYNQLSNS